MRGCAPKLHPSCTTELKESENEISPAQGFFVMGCVRDDTWQGAPEKQRKRKCVAKKRRI